MSNKFWQVSTKETELGIAACSIVNYRYELVDYLPWMYVYELAMSSKKAEEIASYDTLVYPVDTYTWGFIIGTTFAMFMVLLTMQELWNSISGKTFTSDHIFQGENTEICTSFISYVSSSFQIFSCLQLWYLEKDHKVGSSDQDFWRARHSFSNGYL